MLWNSVGSLVYFGFQWLMTVVVVRVSGNYEAAGVLALSMAVYNIISPFTVYRMFTYQISDVEHENSLGEYLTFRMVTVAIGMAFAGVYSLLTCPISAFIPIMLYLISKMCSQFLDSFHATMQLNSRMDYIGKSYALQGAGTFASFFIVFYLTQSLSLAFASMIVVEVAVGVFYVYPRGVAFEPVQLGISFEKVKHLLVYCFPIVIAAVACSASPSIPRQFLAMAQGESMLGIYASVAAPAAVIQMGASYIYTPLLSAFATDYFGVNKKGFVSLLKKATVGIAIVGVLASILLLVCGDWLLALLFGPSVVEYAYLLLPVIWCTIITAYLWFFNDLLIAIRQFKGAFVGNAIALIVTLIVTIPVVNTFGANGVSFTNIIAFAVGTLVLTYYLLAAIRGMTAQEATEAE